MNYSSFHKLCINAILEASEKILYIYNNQEFKIDIKADNSPVTQADFASNEIISRFLAETKIPILTEEGKHSKYEIRKNWEYFWLVDPLDGTKEFINKNGDFTINIALIHNQKPVLGFVFAPTHNELFFADEQNGAFYVKTTNLKTSEEILKNATKIDVNQEFNGELRVVASRSHLSDETKQAIEKIDKKFNVSFKSRGSSLKMCLLAVGEAEYYPRFSPTMEWDTAAGQIVLIASGGKIIDVNTNQSLIYNKENLLNPNFLAFSKSVVHLIEEIV